MEVRQVHVVVALAEHAHFGHAAAALGLSQSRLSQSLRALETELGTSLFDRTTRSVSITQAGQAFLDHARPGLEALDKAAAEATSIGRGELGAIRLGLVGSALEPSVVRILRTYRQRFPGVAVSVSELTTAEQLVALDTGAVDAGFVRPPLPAPHDGRTTLQTLSRDRLVAAVPREHPHARSTTISLAALAGDGFVRTPRHLGPGFYDRIEELCRQAGFSPRTVQEATRIDSVVGLVAAGFGVSVVPDPGRRVTGVSFVPLARTTYVELALVVTSTRPLTPQTETFVRLARDLLGPQDE